MTFRAWRKPTLRAHVLGLWGTQRRWTSFGTFDAFWLQPVRSTFKANELRRVPFVLEHSNVKFMCRLWRRVGWTEFATKFSLRISDIELQPDWVAIQTSGLP
jgi:hypothetical protein